MKEDHATGAPAGPQHADVRRPVLAAVVGRIPVTGAEPRMVSAPHKLVALPSAAGCARRYARAQARAWQRHGLADAAGLLAAELVARAVATIGAPAPARYADLHNSPLNFVIVRLRAQGAGLVIEVWDRDPAPPVPGSEPAGAETEHRLGVLATLSSSWGYYPHAGGKVVWCECRPGSRAAEAAAAPFGALLTEAAAVKAR